MNKKIFLIFSILNLSLFGKTYSQCEADHLVILINFEFTPSELTISPGETVAFINIEREYTVNGKNNIIT